MSGSAYPLLVPKIQEAIFQMGWKQLRPIQNDSVKVISESNQNLLICAATASGKTEAAFLPIISKISEGEHTSIRAIYVGPLKALINDQFSRLDQLCEKVEVPVHRWHGDVTASHKQALRKNPGGILLITPESLESNFINFGTQIPRLYSQVEFIVIDELHSFLGNVRGIHLLSLLSRLISTVKVNPRCVGLSATLGDPEIGKEFLNTIAKRETCLIQDSTAGKEIRFALKAILKQPDSNQYSKIPRPSAEQVFEFLSKRTSDQLIKPAEPDKAPYLLSQPEQIDQTSGDLDDIADDLVRHFAKSTNLVFVNSRRTAEELAVRTHDRVVQAKWPHDPFMIHHGSVSKELREEAESALKSGVPTTVFCSSTLEMGIDIGSVRAVGQIDPPWSVASFVQRLGRSGRREGEPAIMRLYVREETPHEGSNLTDLLFPELLRGIAITRLMQQKWLESADKEKKHLSTFVHQILSHLKQTGGMHAAPLFEALCVTGPFRVDQKEFAAIIRSLALKRIVEQIPTGELILAPEGEKITAAKDFYAAFKGSEMFVVRSESSRIGELPFDALPPLGQLVILAGKRWSVKEIDVLSKTVWVFPSQGGKVPTFLGNGGELHTRVAQEMKTVLLSKEEPPYLDQNALLLLKASRHVAENIGLHESDIVISPGGVRWFPWVGTRCLRTIAVLAQLSGVACDTDRVSIWFAVEDRQQFFEVLRELTNHRDRQLIGNLVSPRAVEKFDEFLPEDLLTEACVHERLALSEASQVIHATLEKARP